MSGGPINSRPVAWPSSKPSHAPVDRGMLVVVVGSSGAGKDSLLSCARASFAQRNDIVFQQRVITRRVDDKHEPHRSVDEATFERMQDEGEFVVHWQAHGLHYGVPRDCLEQLARGRIVVVNGSRDALPRIALQFPRRRIVHVTVPPKILERRLRARGRESEEAVARRLARKIDPSRLDGSVWKLDNSGSLNAAATRLIDWLEALSVELATRGTV